MALTIAAVHGKARAFVEGLARLPPRGRTAAPHGHFARDYNTLRKLALDVAPELDERLLGKYIAVYETPSGEFSQARYVEIEVYARQIVEQLGLLLISPPSRLVPTTTSQAPSTARAKAYDVATIRQAHNQAYASWSAIDDEYLQSRLMEGATVEDLVSEFGRQPGAIRSRLRKLGLQRPRDNPRPAAVDFQDEQPR
jgi:hypothetical protein